MKIFKCIVLLGTILFLLVAQVPKPLQKIEDMGLLKLEGEITVYYSEGYLKRATYLQNLTTDANRYFKKPEIFGIKVDLQLAVLGSEDWARYTKLPYGIAHIQSQPPAAILAASSDNILVNGILERKDQMSESTKSAISEMNITYKDAAVLFVDLIGFHEMGHIYAHHHGCHPWPNTKWLSEFIATYLSYSYMRQKQPKMAKVWGIISRQMSADPNMKYTALEDFEKLYIGVGHGNYGWYQAKFNRKVEEVYTKSGISFIHALKKLLKKKPESSKDDPFRLKDLDVISPGFTSWAKGPTGELK